MKYIIESLCISYLYFAFLGEEGTPLKGKVVVVVLWKDPASGIWYATALLDDAMWGVQSQLL
jgi:hypothetical protein